MDKIASKDDLLNQAYAEVRENFKRLARKYGVDGSPADREPKKERQSNNSGANMKLIR